jgi:hypothetical protein
MTDINKESKTPVLTKEIFEKAMNDLWRAYKPIIRIVHPSDYERVKRLYESGRQK